MLSKRTMPEERVRTNTLARQSTLHWILSIRCLKFSRLPSWWSTRAAWTPRCFLGSVPGAVVCRLQLKQESQKSSRGCSQGMRKRRRQGDTSNSRALSYSILPGQLSNCEYVMEVPPGLGWDGSRRASRPAGSDTPRNDSDRIGRERRDPP